MVGVVAKAVNRAESAEVAVPLGITYSHLRRALQKAIGDDALVLRQVVAGGKRCASCWRRSI